VTFELGGKRNAARGPLKAIASFAAAIVFAAQLLAISHYHQVDPVRRYNAQAQIFADDGICALCNLAFHLPLNPAASPYLERPQIDARAVDQPVAHVIGSRAYSLSQTRAPPAARV